MVAVTARGFMTPALKRCHSSSIATIACFHESNISISAVRESSADLVGLQHVFPEVFQEGNDIRPNTLEDFKASRAARSPSGSLFKASASSPMICSVGFSLSRSS
jgi:hypothetical protein